MQLTNLQLAIDELFGHIFKENQYFRCVGKLL